MDPFTLSLIIGGALALTTGAIKAQDKWKENQKTKSDIEDAQDRYDTLIEDLNTRKELEEKKKKNELEGVIQEFWDSKDEAEKKAAQMNQSADLTDLGQDIEEQKIANDFNTAIDNLYLNQSADTMSWNSAAIQSGASKGASYAALAGSGVRSGSSLSDAVLMESATNGAQLQFSQNAKRRSDENNLGSVLNSLAGNQFNVYQNRVGADMVRSNALDLRNSYKFGGSQFNIYRNRVQGINDQWAITAENYRQQAEEYKFKKKQLDNQKQYLKDNEWWDYTAAFFGGGASGFSTGYNTSKTLINDYNAG